MIVVGIEMEGKLIEGIGQPLHKKTEEVGWEIRGYMYTNLLNKVFNQTWSQLNRQLNNQLNNDTSK